MQPYIEPILTLFGTILAVLIAGWFQNRSNKKKLQAEADKLKAESDETYHDMALKETQERERLEARFEQKLAERDTKIQNLSKEIDCLHAEREIREKERTQERELWNQEKKHLEQKINGLERTHEAERKAWSLEKQTMQGQIEHLEGEINKLKNKTGSLEGK